MGTTTSGLPYPEDTDPVAQGAQAIKGLANRLAPGASGVTSIAVNNSTTGTGSVTFPVGRFTVPPAVTVSSNSGSWVAFMGTPTATGTTLGVVSRAGTTGTTTLPVYWVAVGSG